MNSATICGIAVIFTLSAEGMPIAVPMTTPMMISHAFENGSTSSVAITASAMPTAAIRLPRTAVFGPVSPESP
ncbi:MAG: hypothetical protein V9E83_00865 [Baekduia sp.]